MLVWEDEDSHGPEMAIEKSLPLPNRDGMGSGEKSDRLLEYYFWS